MSEHLHVDQLFEQLYGAEAHPHLDSCPECSARLAELRRQRSELTAPAPVPAEFLVKQRAAILNRMDRPRISKWIPALAAACAIAIGLFVYRPTAAPHVEAGDEQLFAEVYSMSQSTEPRAAAPIHALFEDNQ